MVTDTAFPEYDVAVAKVIDDVLLDMGYVIFPVLTLVLYPHCLLTDSNNMYAIGVICILSSDAVSVAHRFKFDSDFIFINTYHVRNTTAMIRTFQCRSCVISICKADWPHYDRVSSFSPLFKDYQS